VHTERNRAVEAEGRILADIVIARSMTHLDGVVLDRVENLQGGDDLAAGEGPDLEFVVGCLGDPLGEVFGAAIDSVEALGPARCEAPFYLGLRLRDGRCGNRGSGEPDAACGNE